MLKGRIVRDKKKDVDYWAEDVKETRKKFEAWRRQLPRSEPEAVSAFVAALECHNDALEDYCIQLRRKLRRAKAKN